VSFNILKQKLASARIIVFPNWTIEFHVHVDTSMLALGVVLEQPEGKLDHLV